MKIVVVLILSVIVVACGGGGNGSNNQEGASPNQPPVTPPETPIENYTKFWVSENGDCLNESPCYEKIIDALDASLQSYQQDDSQIHEIHVFPGTYVSYEEGIPVILTWHPVKILSVEGPEQTIITGYNDGECAEIIDPGFVLIQGFTFSECGTPNSPYVNDYSAIYVQSYFDMDLHLIGNIFENNGNLFSRSGYAIDINPYFVNFENINVRIEKNIIRNNLGGINLDLNYSDVEDALPSHFIIANNLIYDNSGILGAEHHCASICMNSYANPNRDKVQVDIINNTIVNNSIGIEAVGASDAIHIENNIVYGNSEVAPQISWLNTGPYSYSPAIIRNNLIIEHAQDPEFVKSSNIIGTPMFYDQYSGDFRLIQGSDGIDLKDSNTRVSLESDFLGEDRVTDGDYDGVEEIDVGAIEYR